MTAVLVILLTVLSKANFGNFENTLKTYLKSPHMLDIKAEGKNLKSRG